MAIGASLTAGQIIRTAMMLAGRIGTSDALIADETDIALLQLQWMLKSLQFDGANLFRLTQESLTIPAGVAEVVLDPRVIDVPEARVVVSSTFQRSLGVFTYNQYFTMPNRIAQGVPTSFAFNKQVSQVSLLFWMVPTVSTQVNFTAARVIEDVSALEDTIDLPQEWTETAYYCLADRLIDALGPGNDPLAAQRVSARAAALYEKAKDFDRPGSIFFRPWGSRGQGKFWRT